MKTILVAGGTGLIGRRLIKALQERGYTTRILTRSPKRKDEFHWDPENGSVDPMALQKVNVLINLSGAGIADKRWTNKRKKELYSSRIGTNDLLYSRIAEMDQLELFISSSGINAYGYDEGLREHSENDPYGTDFLATLVRDWERSALNFNTHCKVALVRTAVVLDAEGGALPKLSGPVRKGIGSPLGNGKQYIPWIHAEDLVSLFLHIIEQGLDGAYNANAGNCTNAELTRTIADSLKKSLWAPAVPSFLLSLLLGEMAEMLLKGAKASNHKILSTGFQFRYPSLKEAVDSLLRR